MRVGQHAVNVFITEHEMAVIKEIAKRERRSVSQLIRFATEEFIERHKDDKNILVARQSA